MATTTRPRQTPEVTEGALNRRRWRGIIPATVVTFILVVAFVGCSSDDSTSDSVATPTTTAAVTTTEAPTTTLAATTTTLAATTTTLAATTTTAEPEELTIIATDFAYGEVPATMQAGSKLSLRNESNIEFHEMALIRLADDDERTLEELQALSTRELEAVGSLKGRWLASPLEDHFTVVLGTGTRSVSSPGRYMIFCTVPVGADPAKLREGARRAAILAAEGMFAQIEGVPSHFQVGQIAEFTVVE